jgi:hypothetical protein
MVTWNDMENDTDIPFRKIHAASLSRPGANPGRARAAEATEKVLVTTRSQAQQDRKFSLSWVKHKDKIPPVLS